MHQAAPAGFSSSAATLCVLDERGAMLSRPESLRSDSAAMHVAALVVESEPGIVLVGYADRLWKVSAR